MRIPSRTGVTAGVAPGAPDERPRGRRRAVVAGLVATGLISSSLILPGIAAAAPPAFPDNIVVFPNRDFVTIEGYQNHVGETALLEVKREGKVIGSAKAAVEEGDVAFEVNHPGGACWGAGTDLQVTPDILPGDVVEISFNGVPAGDTTVQDTFVTGSTLTGTTLTVVGHIGAKVNPTQLEQRIVNPDLTATDVNRRDARAVPGPLAPAPKGGYQSQLVVTGDTFTATYNFNTQATATIAANGGGERMMAWEVQDPDGNRQGLTIAELGELGGPGMGGCPAGAVQVGPVGPTNVTAVRSTDKASVKLGWTPAAAVPGTAPITGYRVTAVSATSTDNEQVEIGRRISGAGATGTTITGLDAAQQYTYEVRSVSSAGETFPPSVPGTGGSGSAGDDVTPPTVNATVSGSNITFSSNEPTASIYYTTGPAPDGVDVFTAGGSNLDETATLFKAGTPVPAPAAGTILKFAAVDLSGNVSDPPTGTVFGGTTSTAPVPAAITTATGTAGQGSVSLGWASTDTSVTGYTVKTYTAATGGTGVASPDTTAKSLTVTGLTTGTPYWFTVTPKNANGAGPESARFGPFTPTAVTDRVSITSARWKARDFRIVGTTSAAAGTAVQIRTGSATGTVVLTGTVTAGAVAGTNDINVRDRNNTVPTNPGRIWVTVGTGVAGPITVTNG